MTTHCWTCHERFEVDARAPRQRCPPCLQSLRTRDNGREPLVALPDLVPGETVDVLGTGNGSVRSLRRQAHQRGWKIHAVQVDGAISVRRKS